MKAPVNEEKEEVVAASNVPLDERKDWEADGCCIVPDCTLAVLDPAPVDPNGILKLATEDVLPAAVVEPRN